MGKLYGAMQAFRRASMQSRGWKAPCKIISIGNLTAGGSGKTPLTIAVAKMLKDSGLQVGVSHRGYKGMYENFPTLVSTADKVMYPAETIGDEAYLIASALPGIPVIVGKERRQAIFLMLKLFPAIQVIVLDDSFQHLKVHHDLDILTFCTDIGLGNGYILPAGYLREGLSAISPKDWAVIYNRNGKSEAQPWENKIKQRTDSIYHTYSTVSWFQDARQTLHPLQELNGHSISLVSGIANPASFEETVKGLGLKYHTHHAYTDHYSFSDGICLEKLLADPSEILLCTQKDLMKLALHHELAPRLAALVQDYHFAAAEDFKKRLLTVLSLKPNRAIT